MIKYSILQKYIVDSFDGLQPSKFGYLIYTDDLVDRLDKMVEESRDIQKNLKDLIGELR